MSPEYDLQPQRFLVDTALLKKELRNFMRSLGEDPTREGLMQTPARFVKAYCEMTTGYCEEPEEILSVDFGVSYDEMVILKGIEYWSLCEHHLLPFHGKATVGYIPSDRVVGLSKLARLVHCFARRLQIQERMTSQIAAAIWEHLDPVGVGVLVSGVHSCMAARGACVEAPMITSAMLGALRDKPETRGEFLRLAEWGG